MKETRTSANKTSRGSQPDQQICIFASALRGRKTISRAGKPLGTISDVVIHLDEAQYPQVVGIVMRYAGTDRFIPSAAIISPDDSVCRCDAEDGELFEQRDGDILVFANLLDRQVVQVSCMKIHRVNDAAFGYGDGQLCLIGIDITAAGLLRRLAPQALGQHLKGSVLDWRDVDPLAAEMPEATVQLSHSKLGGLHPSDLGRIVGRLPHRHGAELLLSFTSETAADVLEEVELERQPAILEHIPTEQAVEIFDCMAPDAAADLMELLPRDEADRLIKRMTPLAGADVKLLLSYPHDSAGGLMTTQFVIALDSDTTRQAIDRLRGEIARPDLVYYVYVVDTEKGRRLKGVVSLRDLLVAKPSEPISAFMQRKTYSVRPDAHREAVARLMGEYNLLALPVVDDAGRMIGLVTVDDVLDVMLPESLRRNLPRLFS